MLTVSHKLEQLEEYAFQVETVFASFRTVLHLRKEQEEKAKKIAELEFQCSEIIEKLPHDYQVFFKTNFNDLLG